MRDRASFVIGLGLALLGAFLVWQAFSIRLMPSDKLMGPRLFPVVIGAGMALLGLVTMFTALSTPPDPPAEGARFDWRSFVWVTASLPAIDSSKAGKRSSSSSSWWCLAALLK